MSLVTFEASVSYVRTNFHTLYPKPTNKTRCSIGGVPKELHAEFKALCTATNMTAGEAIAALLDFKTEYEDANAEQLAEEATTRR